MAKLSDTAITVIGIGILVMNLDQLLRQLCIIIEWLVSKSIAAAYPCERMQNPQTHFDDLTKFPHAKKLAA